MVAAVVVNYNARHVLSACLASLRAEGIGEIVVVDNGSADGSESVVRACDPAAVWLSSGANIGYGRAANLGAGRPASGALLVCNPDVVVRPGAVAALLSALEADPSVGIVGPRLLNADGTIYPSARSFPSLVDAVGHGLLGLVWAANPFSRRYKLLDWDHADERTGRLGLGGVPAGSPAGVGRDRRIRSLLLHVHGGRRPVLAGRAGRAGGSGTSRPAR